MHAIAIGHPHTQCVLQYILTLPDMRISKKDIRSIDMVRHIQGELKGQATSGAIVDFYTHHKAAYFVGAYKLFKADRNNNVGFANPKTRIQVEYMFVHFTISFISIHMVHEQRDVPDLFWENLIPVLPSAVPVPIPVPVAVPVAMRVAEAVQGVPIAP